MKRGFAQGILALLMAGLAAPAFPQTGTSTEITFTAESDEMGAAQLRRLLAQYDLDPWIFTDTVNVEAGTEPHSMPVLTMNTDYSDNDLRQLSIFIHEQAHWLVFAAEGRDAALVELREKYPDAPADSDRLYQHLIVAWVELDALAELLGEAEARRVLRDKVVALTPGLNDNVASQYRWYNFKVLDETAAIGDIVKRHGMLVTPQRGLTIE